MRKSLRASIIFALLAATPVWAQGTPEQREACSNDAFRFCDAQVPDAIAVEACLRQHMRSLSPACRREFGGGSAPRRGRRH